MRVTSKGQVTIPEAIRAKLGIQPGTEVTFVERGENIILEVCATEQNTSYSRFTKMRGMLKNSLTTDEIMQLTRGS